MRISKNAWKGKLQNGADAEFEQFIDLKHGIRAVYKQIITDHSRGLNTIEKIINKYAPPIENNTTAYINTVSKQSGIGAKTKIEAVTKSVLLALAKGIVNVENFGGANKKWASLIDNNDYEEAYAILGKTVSEAAEKKK
jgi:hypothetical protein